MQRVRVRVCHLKHQFVSVAIVRMLAFSSKLCCARTQPQGVASMTLDSYNLISMKTVAKKTKQNMVVVIIVRFILV